MISSINIWEHATICTLPSRLSILSHKMLFSCKFYIYLCRMCDLQVPVVSNVDKLKNKNIFLLKAPKWMHQHKDSKQVHHKSPKLNTYSICNTHVQDSYPHSHTPHLTHTHASHSHIHTLPTLVFQNPTCDVSMFFLFLVFNVRVCVSLMVLAWMISWYVWMPE